MSRPAKAGATDEVRRAPGAYPARRAGFASRGTAVARGTVPSRSRLAPTDPRHESRVALLIWNDLSSVLVTFGSWSCGAEQAAVEAAASTVDHSDIRGS